MIETIDFSKSEQYTLSIRLSADGFSFSVFNPLGEGELSFFDRKVEESLSLTANLKQTFREIEWLKHPYRRVNILMADKRFTLVPLELKTNRRKHFFIITTRSGKTKLCNTTFCEKIMP